MIAPQHETATLPAHDTAAAVDFLLALIPSGRVALCAIEPDGPVSGLTVEFPHGAAAARAFLDRWQGVANLHWTLNEPKPPGEQTGRAGKLNESDIVCLRGVVIDIDPNREEEKRDGGAERERVRLAALKDVILDHWIGRPTAVISSGSGLQVVWMLAEPLPVTPGSKLDTVGQARGLAKAYGSDPVHSLDHLFRIPFTVNLPNRSKAARGRVRCFSSVLHLDTSSLWSPAALQLVAKPIYEAERTAPTADAAEFEEAMAYVGARDDLPADLARRVAAAPALRALVAADRVWQDRSGKDFAIAAACVDAGIIVRLEVGIVVAAYGSEKVEERGAKYLAGTVTRALATTKPPQSYFEPLAAPAPSEAAPDATAATISWIDPTKWEGIQPEPLQWEVEGWIPRNEVTLLYGDGGIGKTLLIHQYATCAATGRSWLGQKTRPARVLCFFCEDSEKELHRRQTAINRIVGVTHADLSNLRIASRKHEDNLFTLWDRNTGAMKRQAVWERLLADALEFRADVVIIDTIADTYSGSEIDRAQVSAFVKSCLGRLAFEIGGSVIALGHPSQAGSQSGSGTSGSTAWSNSARSRLFMKYPGKTDRGDFRELEGKKSNYGPKGNTLKIRWHAGAFEAISSSAQSIGAEQLPQTDDAAEKAVVGALVSYGRNRLAMGKHSSYFAPKLLKAHEPDGLAAFSVEEVESALRRLLARGAVKAETVDRDASRRPVPGLVVVADRLSEVVTGRAADARGRRMTCSKVPSDLQQGAARSLAKSLILLARGSAQGAVAQTAARCCKVGGGGVVGKILSLCFASFPANGREAAATGAICYKVVAQSPTLKGGAWRPAAFGLGPFQSGLGSRGKSKSHLWTLISGTAVAKPQPSTGVGVPE